MTLRARSLIIMVVVSALAALVGGWIGVRWGLSHAAYESELHVVLHHKLHLTAAQEQRIDASETEFAPQEQALEAEMRAANQDLASALHDQHAYGPDAGKAVQRFHKAMEALQEATIRHVLAMRAVLTPDQAQIFDRTVERVLTAPAP